MVFPGGWEDGSQACVLPTSSDQKKQIQYTASAEVSSKVITPALEQAGSSLLSEHEKGFKEVGRSREQHLTASSREGKGVGITLTSWVNI